MKHLICHVYPKAGGTWRDTVSELRQRIELFDGRRVFGIVHGDGLESMDSVRHELSDIATDFIVAPNNPGLREVVTLRPAIDILCRDPQGAAMFCHTKGATHSADSICQEWRHVMMSACLDFPELIDAAIDDKPIVGPFRRFGGLGVAWHFSGSFFWFRVEDLWRREWRYVQESWFGVETFPACNFHDHESRCLFLDNCGDLYDSEYWSRVVRPAFRVWKERLTACTRLQTTP